MPYLQSLDKESFAPFDNWTQWQLHLIRVLCPMSEECFSLFLTLMQDPRFDPAALKHKTAAAFDRETDCKLALPKIIDVKTSFVKVIKKKKKDAEGNVVIFRRQIPVQAAYASVIDQVQHIQRDPVMRQLMTRGADEIDLAVTPCTEMNQSPLFREHLRYSCKLDIVIDHTQFFIGDLCRVKLIAGSPTDRVTLPGGAVEYSGRSHLMGRIVDFRFTNPGTMGKTSFDVPEVKAPHDSDLVGKYGGWPVTLVMLALYKAGVHEAEIVASVDPKLVQVRIDSWEFFKLNVYTRKQFELLDIAPRAKILFPDLEAGPGDEDDCFFGWGACWVEHCVDDQGNLFPHAVPERVELSSPVVTGKDATAVPGEPYLDSFCSDEKNGLRTGVYYKFCMMLRKLAGMSSIHLPLMWFNSRADTTEMMAPFRKEMKAVQDGVWFWNPLLERQEQLHMPLLKIDGDYQQLLCNCAGGGTQSEYNCPQCRVTKKTRLDTTIDLNDCRMQRDQPLLEAVVAQLNAVGQRRINQGKQWTHGMLEAARKAFALGTSAFSAHGVGPFAGCGIDPCKQSMRDPQHLFYFGFIPDFLNYVMTTILLSKAARRDLAKRLQLGSQDLPSHCTRHSYQVVNDDKGTSSVHYGKAITMESYRQIALLALFEFESFVPPDFYEHFCQLFQLMVLIEQPLTLGMLRRIQIRAARLVLIGQTLCPSIWTRPNGHGLLELVFRTLPAVMNSNFCATGVWERIHQQGKAKNKVLFRTISS
jgi:hypothetical protein